MSARIHLISALVWLAGPSAWAGQWLSECKSEIDKSKNQCQQAYNSYKSSDASRLASGMASSTNDANGNAKNLKGKIDAAKAELDKDIAQCKQAQQSCKSKCDQKKSEAEQEAAKPDPNPMKQIAQSDARQIPQEEQKDCTGYIQPRTQEMEAGRKPLDQQSNEADKTRDQSQSGGGSPQSQSPSPSPSPSPSSTADSGSSGAGLTNQKPAALDCAVAGASRFSNCDETFKMKCTNGMTASECDAFTDRYCNLGAAPAPSTLPTATTNLVIDKRGEGLGSSYCSYANSYRYCQTPGRESCPSCLKVYAQSSCQGIGCIAQTSNTLTQSQQAACPDDPSYLTPVTGKLTTPSNDVAAAVTGATSGASSSTAAGAVSSGTSSSGLMTASAIGGGSSGGGRGSSGSTGGGALGSGATGAVGSGPGGADSKREDGAGAIIGSTDVSGGGGGSGGTGADEPPWISGSERDLASLDLRRAFDGKKDEPGRPVAGGAADVANSFGPSLFTLGSSAIHGFCVRGRIPSCN